MQNLIWANLLFNNAPFFSVFDMSQNASDTRIDFGTQRKISKIMLTF